MKFNVPSASRAPQIALTSMLDVIFLLLCFFVTVSVFSQWENEIAITLPQAKTSDEPDRLPGEIIVNLFSDGAIKVNGNVMTLDDLGCRLKKLSEFYPGQAVIVRSDKETKYDQLVKLLDTCRAAGVWNFSFATEGEGSVEGGR